jgi:hypothetical protein
VRESLNWENVTRSGSTVQGMGRRWNFLFASFESGRRNSNSIMVYDLQSLRLAEFGGEACLGVYVIRYFYFILTK